jgi:TPR repeat protein
MWFSKYAWLFHSGDIGPNTGHRRLLHMAQNGHPAAQELLGERSAKPAGEDEHRIEAVKWLDAAVRQGRDEARPKLKALIATIPWPLVAEGRRRSYAMQQAITNTKNRWPPQAGPRVREQIPHMSAEQLMIIGSRYNDGDGVAVDFEVAFAAFLRAATLGVREAQFNVGLAYNVSKGVLGDPAKALEWYGKAAAQGHGDAVFAMAAMHARGDGVPADSEKALAYLADASRLGHPMAEKFAQAVREGWEIS